MSRSMRLGSGIVGLVATATSAFAQFAVDRPPVAAPATGPAPIVATPQVPIGPAPIVAAPPSFEQATRVEPARPTPAPKAVGPAPSTHPWYVKPEVGQWMILVKSYSDGDVEGDGEGQARSMAERLAREIRETYRIPAYLFEKGSEERRQEEARVARETEKKRAIEEKAFLDFNNRMRAESAAKGMEFMESAPRYLIPRVRFKAQYGVLIGGWKDMETARKELDKIRQWQPPKDQSLMDRGFTLGEKGANGAREGQIAFMNPFLTAFVVRNPVAQLVPTAESGNDPLVIRMNHDEPLSVLKIQKPWTIVVKSFHAPLIEVKDKDADSSMKSRKPTAVRRDQIDRTAGLAVNLAKMLRELKPSGTNTPRAVEAYVLHTLSGSLVCVGQYDSADDPRMLAEQQRLELIRFNVQGDNSTIYPFDRSFVAMRVK